MSSQLHLDVFVPCKPIAGQMAPIGQGEATRPATCGSRISGEHDAVVIDADLAPTGCGAVVIWVGATGKNLTTIYITVGHGDHFFVLNTIIAAFPTATAVTAAAIVPETPGQGSPGQMQFWATMFPGQIPGHPAVPAVQSTVVDMEGHELRVTGAGQSDTDPWTIVCISSPDAVSADDAAYDGNQSLSDSRSARHLADAMMAVPGNPYTLWTAA